MKNISKMNIFENEPIPRPNFIQNGKVITDNCVAMYKDNFLHVSDIPILFSQFNGGQENLHTFLEGNRIWAAPNADITPLKFDPFTGEKIDWSLIKLMLS